MTSKKKQREKTMQQDTALPRADKGTPELRKQIMHVSSVALHVGHSAENVQRLQNLVQVPLDYYASHDWISPRQYDAGDELHRLWYYGAEKSGYVLTRMVAKVPGGLRDFETKIILEQKYNAAKRAVRGLLKQLICYNVCCLGEWASYLGFKELGTPVRRMQKMDILRDGLDDLADHFKYPKK
jgi:hypothetical protein